MNALRCFQAQLAAYARAMGSGPLLQIYRRQAQRRLTLWAARAGSRRPVSPHSLRHSFAMDSTAGRATCSS